MDVEKIFSLSNDLFDKTRLNFEQVSYILPPKFSKDLSNSVLYSSIWTLDTYYNMHLEDKEVQIGYQHSIVIREMLKNSRWHGGSKDESPTLFSLFTHPDKFALGCFDGGDYFKRADIKEIWENKNELKEYHDAKQYGIGYHVGYRYFKDKFDEIKIDTENGVFYGIVNMKDFFTKNAIELREIKL